MTVRSSTVRTVGQPEPSSPPSTGRSRGNVPEDPPAPAQLHPSRLGDEATAHPSWGTFRWDTVSDSWQWSAAVYAILGHPVGSVERSTGLLRSHQHPGSASVVDQMLAACREGATTFSSNDRIVTQRGRAKVVLTLGVITAGEQVIRGQMVDLTSQHRAAGTEAVRVAGQSHDLVDRAVGALMLGHRLDATAAHDLLVRHSQDHDVKIGVLAGRLLEQLPHVAAGAGPQETLDRLLLDQNRPEPAPAPREGPVRLAAPRQPARHGEVALR